MAKIDFSLTDDGDLLLGAPRLNDDNKVLYYHRNGTVTVDPYQDGLAGTQIKDLSYKIGRDAWHQIIVNRLKTDAPDWYHHPTMGGNLTDLVGEPQTKDTGLLGAQYIVNALTYGGLLSATQVSVRPTPINENEIMFLITLDINDSEPYRMPLIFNLNYGLKEE